MQRHSLLPAICSAAVVAGARLTLAVLVLFCCLMPAHADVRAAVGEPLQAAIVAVKAGDYRGAYELVLRAEAVGDLSDEERSDIDQMKDYIATKSGGAYGVASAIGAQAKFTSDYRAGRYRDAIADEALLRQYGALSETNIIVIAQAYELLEDYKGCARYASSQAITSPTLTGRQLKCMWEAHDDLFARSAITDALSYALVAAASGCHDNAVLHLQAALAFSDMNPDERDIVRRMDAYVAEKSQLPDPGDVCRKPETDTGQPSALTL